MGKAQATCLSGCTCSLADLDGHEYVQKHSVPRLHAIGITPGNAGTKCVLQLRVLNESGSGEHKVKVMSVVTSIDVELPPLLAALRRKAQALAAAGGGGGGSGDAAAPAAAGAALT
jgi:hypothetical protein